MSPSSRREALFRWSNFNFSHFTVGTGTGTQQLYAVKPGSNRIYRCTDIFLPTASNKNDGDGTAVLPVVEYPCRRGWSRFQRKWVPTEGLTHWRRVYLSWDIRDAASDDPTLQAAYVENASSTSYTNLVPAFAETTAKSRSGISFGPTGERGGRVLRSFGLKLTQTAASSDTRVYSFEGDFETIEGSRLDFFTL